MDPVNPFVPPWFMSDAARPNHSHVYRAYRVNPGEAVSAVAVYLDATNDDEAIAQAHKLVDGVGIELWDRARLVISLPPKE